MESLVVRTETSIQSCIIKWSEYLGGVYKWSIPTNGSVHTNRIMHTKQEYSKIKVPLEYKFLVYVQHIMYNYLQPLYISTKWTCGLSVVMSDKVWHQRKTGSFHSECWLGKAIPSWHNADKTYNRVYLNYWHVSVRRDVPTSNQSANESESKSIHPCGMWVYLHLVEAT